MIVGGRAGNVLTSLANGKTLGTLLVAEQEPIAARKQWLAGSLQVRGSLTLDAGAVRVLKEQGKSLLPVGVKSVVGDFHRGDLVRCVDESGCDVARGLANYNASESRQIIGKSSQLITEILGYCDDEELIHRDNLVLV